MASNINYLQKFCYLLEDTEVPPRFAIWCGLASLLATLERSIWIEQGIYTIYPNFFFVLVAGSGQKKSTAINLCDRLLRRTDPGPKIIAQMITPEGLINSLKVERVDDEEENMKKTCGGIILADELVTLIDKKTIERGLGQILTTLYDCKEYFDYQTVSRGNERIYNAHLSLLGGTTVELIKDAIPLAAVGGGLTSRMVFIYEDSTPPPVPWIDFNPAHAAVEEELIRYLQDISTLSGKIEVTAEAKAYYVQDYLANYDGKFRANPYLRGYANRRHAHLFKIAIAVMVAENPSLTMTQAHLQGAKIILEQAEENMEAIIDMIVSSDQGTSTNHVYNFIKSKGNAGIGRSALIRHYSHRFDAKEISGIMETLLLSKRISADVKPGSGGLLYKVSRDGQEH